MGIIEVGQTTRVLVHLTKERDKLLSPLGTVKFAIELYKFNSILFLFSPELTQRVMLGVVKIVIELYKFYSILFLTHMN
jgi:hypothetical protein